MGKSSSSLFKSKGGLILILAAIILIIYINESHIRKYLDIFTSEAPKENLKKAENALEKHDIQGSLDAINIAIESLDFVENYTDSVATYFIEKSINELENLKTEIEKEELNIDDYKHAYYEAYSSMAYTNLRLSELEFKEGSKEKAYEHFSNCFSYLQMALKYVTDPKKDNEIRLINEVNAILTALNAHEDLDNFDFNKINGEMEELMN